MIILPKKVAVNVQNEGGALVGKRKNRGFSPKSKKDVKSDIYIKMRRIRVMKGRHR